MTKRKLRGEAIPEASEWSGDEDVCVQEDAAILSQHVEFGVDVALCLLCPHLAFRQPLRVNEICRFPGDSC